MLQGEETKMDDALVNFFTRRASMLSHLDNTRAQIDAWLATHFNTPDTDVKDLAFLEGLLHERRTALNDLLALDEKAIEDLIRMSGKLHPSTTPAP